MRAISRGLDSVPLSSSRCAVPSPDSIYSAPIAAPMRLIHNSPSEDPMSPYGPSNPLGDRRCGACTACCVHLPIPAGLVGPGSKPAGIPCPQVCGSGCRIYSQRPGFCADFSCAWFDAGSWLDAWRPDRSGLLGLRERIDGGLTAAVLYEIRPGALEEPLAVEILGELRRATTLVITVDARQHRVHLPRHWVGDLAHTGAPAPHFLVPRRTARQDDPAAGLQV